MEAGALSTEGLRNRKRIRCIRRESGDGAAVAEIYPDQDDKEETVVQTNIYLVTDNRTPMKQECSCGYVMEAVDMGNCIGTAQGWHDCLEDRYGALLLALAEAAGRMKPSCAGASSVLIITDCRPLASGILSLKRWERDGWVRSKGRPIKRKEKWERVAKALQGYQIAAQVKRVDLYEDLLRKGECDER